MASDDIFLSEITAGFTSAFDGERCSFISRASGRAELIGGHTDYNDGFVIAIAVNSSYWVAARARNDAKVRIYSHWARQMHEFSLDVPVEPLETQKWANYGRGVAAVLLENRFRLRGADLFIIGNVPIGGGLSSSAAMEVSLARAMLHICGQLQEVGGLQLAKMCQRAENRWAGSPCGIMDQMVSIHGRRGSAVILDCRDLAIRYEPLNHAGCAIMIFNSMVRHEVGGGEYGKRRRMCEKAVEMIAQKYPDVRALRDVDEKMLEEFKDGMDDVMYRRALHVVTENARVLAGAEALKKNDITEFGRIVAASGRSARDN
ncbi:MAG TPA: galactokinase, partial [Sedimentisphaerales bacterium]|nr:galactokinase [Sedimentisphaerales bacterium]